MNAVHQNRPWQLRRVQIGDGFRTGFVLTCSNCGAEATIHADPNCAPHIIVSKFVKLGWAANERNAAGCYCPACIKGAKPKAKTTIEPETAARSASIPSPTAELPKGPTHEQRKRIAEQLRGCFDEDRGCYLDGETDQRIGERLGMPWSWVREVRDLLGFEIRIDPEIEALRAEVAALADMVVALDRKLDALLAKRIGS